MTVPSPRDSTVVPFAATRAARACDMILPVIDRLQQTLRTPMPVEEAVLRHLRLYRDDAFALAH